MSGNPFNPKVMMRHGFIDRADADDNCTAIFDDFVDEINNRRILLDHILVSPALFSSLADGRVEHAHYEFEVDHNLAGRVEYPSDHRPQSVTI